MKKQPLYRFSDPSGSFEVDDAARQGPLYFPLVNEQAFMSAITPDLAGDIKLDQHSFLLPPVAFEDLHLSRAARNFWLTIGGKPWSVSGRSVWQRASNGEESTDFEAGLLWQRVTRSNRRLGVKASVLSFVPAGPYKFEVMQVTVTNTGKKPLTFTPTSAIPLFGRSADNLRDHRHVTSLLHRLKKEKYGLSLTPTMTFNERGHLVNHTAYFVLGKDNKGRAPKGFFPTVESFVGEGGDLENPLALVKTQKPAAAVVPNDQGKEAIGALQFETVTLKAGQSARFNLILGIQTQQGDLPEPPDSATVDEWVETTKKYWDEKLATIRFETGDDTFNGWVRWVQLQPTLRKLFGCSFLPDFDYGRGGRGWRDLWQDCLALLLQTPEEVRDDIVHNFGGVRIDGSNATIIGRQNIGGKWFPEFIADRNNISRTWMDHGVWPFLTSLLYLNQTGDWNFLLETVPYFRDRLIHRAQKVDFAWRPSEDAQKKNKLLGKDGEVYQGTVLEHILVQTLVQFFNVGDHNIIRLEDADWNDGLDMAHHRGESVAFTNLYGGNLDALANLLEKLADRPEWETIEISEEVTMLLDRLGETVNYADAGAKRRRLEDYFTRVSMSFSGERKRVPTAKVAADLREKALWIQDHINKQEWIEVGGQAWFNGYYDDQGKRVEGKDADGHVRMTLSGQVYPIMAGMADESRVKAVVKAVNAYLFDEKLGGVRLNTDFGSIQPKLGRAFSFAYGEKENGAVFSHMAVMYANALYQRGFASEGFRVLQSLYTMAKNSARSRIFPGLPEYFNNEGRGRYMYLTGSASWYVLTLLTQAFGVRGLDGDLLIAPKLDPAQFDKKGKAAVTVQFAGARVRVTFTNAKRVPYESMRIKSTRFKDGEAKVTELSEREVVISRSDLAKRKDWEIDVELG